MHDSSVVIGIDIGGTKIALATYNFAGEQIFAGKVTIDESAGEEVGQLIVNELKSMIIEIEEKRMTLKAVGACIPGITDPKTETVWAPNIKGWEKFPLKELLEKVVQSKVPVIIESDRSCHLLGEVWKGRAQGKTDVVFLAVGTGLAIGILSNGHVINGAKGIAGAIGWWGLSENYRKEYQNFGDLEYHASGDGLMRYAKETLDKHPELQGYFTSKSLQLSTSADLFKAFDSSDKLALRVFDKATSYWGICIANIISILNPEMIVMGGGVFGPAERFMPQIIKEAQQWAQPISMKQVEICSTSLKGNAGLLGAAYAAIKTIEL